MQDIKRPLMYVVGQDVSYYRPWSPLFALADSAEEADVVLFTGGADISPALYGEKNVMSYPSKGRDEYEVQWFEWCKENKKPMIGICRGAQLICALNGGKLFQHVPHHTGGDHPMVTEDGKEYEVSTCHHQMLRPAGDFRLLAWCPIPAGEYWHEKDGIAVRLDANPQGRDPEVVYYNDLRALCIQGHPEFMETNCVTNQYFRQLAKDLLL